MSPELKAGAFRIASKVPESRFEGGLLKCQTAHPETAGISRIGRHGVAGGIPGTGISGGDKIKKSI